MLWISSWTTRDPNHPGMLGQIGRDLMNQLNQPRPTYWIGQKKQVHQILTRIGLLGLTWIDSIKQKLIKKGQAEPFYEALMETRSVCVDVRDEDGGFDAMHAGACRGSLAQILSPRVGCTWERMQCGFKSKFFGNFPHFDLHWNLDLLV